MMRTDPNVVRALALSKWPELRTEVEQRALDKWLNERLEAGIMAWAIESRISGSNGS